MDPETVTQRKRRLEKKRKKQNRQESETNIEQHSSTTDKVETKNSTLIHQGLFSSLTECLKGNSRPCDKAISSSDVTLLRCENFRNLFLKNRLTTQHQGSLNPTCKLCKIPQSRTFASYSRVNNVEFPEDFVCQVCKMKSVLKAKLMVCELSESEILTPSKPVVSVHTEEKPYRCAVCDECFDKQNFSVHMQTHKPERKKLFVCEFCGNSFTRKDNLEVHRRTHTGGKPFLCDNCGSRFTYKSALSKHLQLHTGEKPFSCFLCKKSFRLNQCLSIHMQKHSGEKPLHCEVCDKGFATRSILTLHMRTHSKRKPFKCEVCKKRFRYKESFSVHMQHHAGV